MSRTKIKTLTKEEKARFGEWTQKWIKIGLSTEPADFETFEKNVALCYQFAKLKPVPVIRVASPIIGAFAAPIAATIICNLLKDKNPSLSTVVSAVESAVVSDVRLAVVSAVESAVRSAVRSDVESAVVSAVGSAVYSAVGSAVVSAVRSAVRSDVGSDVESAVSSAVRSAVESAVVSAVSSAVRSDVGSAVRSSVYSAVVSDVVSAVRSDVSSAIGPFVESAVRSAVYSAVDSAVVSAVSSDVYSAVRSDVGSAYFSPDIGPDVFSTPRLFWHEWFGGRFWAGWQAYVTFFLDVCDWQPPDNILDRARAYENCQKSVGFWWPNKYFCVVSDTPKKIALKNNQLHCENGKAIEYRDNWGLYFLNGARMEEWHVTTKAEDIKPEQVMAETNIERRRELIRKIGKERLLKTGKLIEEQGEYALYDMAALFTNVSYAPHLLMKNPSVPGVFHLEGVGPECKTIDHARNWRRYKDINQSWKPSFLS